MDVSNQFTDLAALLCEPVRAKMLWSLLDGRACTAGEMALAADISATAASNHLTLLLNAELLKVEKQGRHRYYHFSRPEVAYVIESLANLSRPAALKKTSEQEMKPMQYCRTCYDHLAGYAGVMLAESLEKKSYLRKSGDIYLVSAAGWKWFEGLGMSRDHITSSRRALTRQCLDWSERRPHLAGAVGAALLDRMLGHDWFRRKKFSRELVITSKGRQQLLKLLALDL